MVTFGVIITSYSEVNHLRIHVMDLLRRRKSLEPGTIEE